MKTGLQVAPKPAWQAYRMVIHHGQREDFSIYRPAGIGLRWYALTLDLTLAAPFDLLVHLPFNRYLERLNAYGHEGRYYVLLLILSAIPMLLYFIGPTALTGQTLGKKIVGLRVVRANYNPDLSFAAVLCRESIGKALSLLLLGIGFLMPAFNLRRRALHDYLGGTMVVTYRER